MAPRSAPRSVAGTAAGSFPNAAPARRGAAPRQGVPAKFLPPRPRHPLVRPRLHALLDQTVPARALWLQAEAGAGKSTLAAAWAAASGRPLAWFRVDATDLDLSCAFAGLVALLTTLSRRRLPAAVLRPPPLADEAALDAFARLFFRAFHAHCGPVALVFDDVHAAPSPGVERLLHAAADETPDHSVVLMTSRAAPQGLLLEAVARGDLVVVDGAALNFTRDEALALLSPRLGTDRAAQLFERTGGWAAGLTLCAAHPGDADRAERTVADFFAQRVLGLLSDQQCQLLAAVSLLPEVDVPGLRALGLAPDAPEQLDLLCTQLGFVQRLRHGHRCWRLHDLLTQALQARWPSLGSPAWRVSLLQAAAVLHAGQGRLLAAVQLLHRADLPGPALALWITEASSLLRQGRAQELKRAFEALDPARVAQDATALTLRGLAAWAVQEADAGDWLDRAWVVLDATVPEPCTPERLLTAAAALNVQFSGWRSYAGRTDWVQRLVAAWPARAGVTDAGSGLRVDKAAILCFLTHRMAAVTRADRDALLQRVLGTLARPDPAIDPNVAVSAASTLVEWCNYTGDHPLLARLADLTPPWLAQPGLAGAVQASWWISYGWVSVRMVMGRNDLPEGEAAVEHGVALALACGASDTAFYGLTNLVAAAASRNQLGLAEQRLQQLHAIAAQRTGAAEQPTQQATLHLLAARLLTLRGQAATALVRVTRALELAQASDFPLSETWVYHLGHVQVLIALGREEDAVALAAAQARVYDGMRRDYLQALGLLAQLAQAWREGHMPPAGQVQDCVALAAKHGWTSLGNHLNGVVARLAAAALAQGFEPGFVQALVRQRHLQAPDADAGDWPWPLRIHALGGFAVWADGQALDFGARPQKKPLDLLRLLVAHGPAPLDTAAVLDALWPEAEGDRAKASLDMALLRLRKLLGHEDAVRLDHGRLGLNRGLVWADAWAWAAGQPLPYAGPLFGQAPPELPWAAQREALHGQYLRRCHAQGSTLERTGQLAEALALYESALQQDPLDETLHRGAIRCLLAQGETAAAQRAFERCRERLQAGLGVAPGLATQALLAPGAASLRAGQGA